MLMKFHFRRNKERGNNFLLIECSLVDNQQRDCKFNIIVEEKREVKDIDTEVVIKNYQKF